MFNWNGQQPRYGFPQQQMIPGFMPQGQFNFQQPLQWLPQQHPPDAAVGMMMGQPWPAAPANPAMLPIPHHGPMGMHAMHLSQGMIVNTSQSTLPPMPDKPPLPAGPPPPLPDVQENAKPPLPESPQAPPLPENKSPPPPDPIVLADLEKLKKEEEIFLNQYKQWKQQYDEWREQNESHPNKEQFEQYLEKWKIYEKQMEARRKSIEAQRNSLNEKLNDSVSAQLSAATSSMGTKTRDDFFSGDSKLQKGEGSAYRKEPPTNQAENEEKGEEDMNLDDEEESACGGIIIETVGGQSSSDFGWPSGESGSKNVHGADHKRDGYGGISENPKKLNTSGNEPIGLKAEGDRFKNVEDFNRNEENPDAVEGSVTQKNDMNDEWRGNSMGGLVGRGQFEAMGRGRGTFGGRGGFGNVREFGRDMGGMGGFEEERTGFEGGWNRAEDENYLIEGGNKRGGFVDGRGFIGRRGGFGRGRFDGEEGGGGFGDGNGGYDGGFDSGRGGFNRRGGFDGNRGGFGRGRGGFEGERGGFEGGKGGFEGGRGGFEGGRGGFEGGRGGFEGGRGGFEGGRGGFEGRSGGFEGGRGGFEGRSGGFEGGRGGFEGGRGGFEGGRGQFDHERELEGGRSGFDSGRGGFEGGRGGFEGGRGGRGGFDGGRGGFEGGRERFEGNRGELEGEREGFDSGRGGYEDERGNFESRIGGFEGGRGGFGRGRGRFENEFQGGRGGFGDDRGGFSRGRGGYFGGRGRSEGGRGGSNVGTFQSGVGDPEAQESRFKDSDNTGNRTWGEYEDEFAESHYYDAGTDNENKNFRDNMGIGRGGRFQRGRGRGRGEFGMMKDQDYGNNYDLGEANAEYGSNTSGSFVGGFRGRGRGRGDGISHWPGGRDDGNFGDYDTEQTHVNNKLNLSNRGRGAKSNFLGGGERDYDDTSFESEDYSESRFEPGRGFQRGGPRGRGMRGGRGRGSLLGNHPDAQWGTDEGSCDDKNQSKAPYFEEDNAGSNILGGRGRGVQGQKCSQEPGSNNEGTHGRGGMRGRGRGAGPRDDFLQEDKPQPKRSRFESEIPGYEDRLGPLSEFDPYRRYPPDPYLRDPYLDPLDPYLPPPPPFGFDSYDRYGDYPPRFDPMAERRVATSVERIDYGHGTADQDKKTMAAAEVIEYGHGQQTSGDESREKNADPEDDDKADYFGDKDFRQERPQESSVYDAKASSTRSTDAAYNQSDKASVDSWQLQRTKPGETDLNYHKWSSVERESSTFRSQEDRWESSDSKNLKERYGYRSDDKYTDRAASDYGLKEEESVSRFDDRYKDREWRGDREKSDRDYRVGDYDGRESGKHLSERDTYDDREREREGRMDRRERDGRTDRRERDGRMDRREREERMGRRHRGEGERTNDYVGERGVREKRAFGIGEEWLKDEGSERLHSRYGSETSSINEDRGSRKDYSYRDREQSSHGDERNYSRGDREYLKDFDRFGENEETYKRHVGAEALPYSRSGESSKRTKSDWREDDSYSKAAREHYGVVRSPERHTTPPVRGHSRVSAAAAHEVMKVEELLCPPQRQKRPPHIVVIIRGLPGSGKTYVSKLLREKEANYGGQAPRILCLDDYFMVEVEKVEKDPETGKRIKKKVLEYEYEQAIEEAYRQSMLKTFKKTIDDGFFPFIIVDAINEKVSNFAEFWSYAKSKGFQVYVAEQVADVALCIQRNIHRWTEWDIEKFKSNWEPLPNHYIRLDIRWLLQEDAIEEVEMEDTANDEQKEDKDDEEDDDELDEGVLTKSKWEFDTSEKTLDKLDGIPVSKKHIIEHQSMDDYLQLDQMDEDYFSRESVPGKKRVRWADLEEKKTQSRRRDLGFIVGQTQRDWERITDDDFAEKALNQTKYYYK